MRIAIMTDTNSGITVEEGKELGVYVLPMPVIIGEKTYLEGKDINTKQLSEKMLDRVLTSTSQPSPGSVLEMWDDILDEG